MSFEYTDMGDLMEIYLFGIKPLLTPLYSSLYLSKVLFNNNIKNITIEQFRENIIKFSNLSIDFRWKDIKSLENEQENQKSNKNEEIINIFKKNEIRKIFIYNFKENEKIFNYKYR